MKAICYALFGYGKAREANSFAFDSYLRGLSLNIMLNRLLYPGWDIVVIMDEHTYNHYAPLIKSMGAIVEVQPYTDFCRMMLWRLRPAFYKNADGSHKYTHIICRDTDSPPTYRERQAVEHWITLDTVGHAITDSVSHGIPMLGGMVGFKPHDFAMRMGVSSWEQLLNMTNMNLSRKGSDQDFMNRCIYPELGKYGHSTITQHYFKGMPATHLPHHHTCLCDPVAGHAEHCYLNVEVPGVDPELSATNSLAGHIGAAGYYEAPMMQMIEKYSSKFADLLHIQKKYKKIFYWAK